MSMRAPRQLTESAIASPEPSTEATGPANGRRAFMRTLTLGGAAAVGAALVPAVVMAGEAAAQTAPSTDAGTDIPAADVATVLFDQSVALAAAAAYEAMAATGKITGPSLETVRLFGRHHTAHAEALGLLVKKESRVTKPNAKVLAPLTTQIDAAKDATALLQIAYTFEGQIAATYQQAMSTLTNFQSATVVAGIEPIVAQHSATLGFTLNLPMTQWVPAFQTTTDALDPTTFAA